MLRDLLKPGDHTQNLHDEDTGAVKASHTYMDFPPIFSVFKCLRRKEERRAPSQGSFLPAPTPLRKVNEDLVSTQDLLGLMFAALTVTLGNPLTPEEAGAMNLHLL